MKALKEEHYQQAMDLVRDHIDVSFKADNIRLDVSPNRAILHEKAFTAMHHQAAQMMKYAANKGPLACLGNCV